MRKPSMISRLFKQKRRIRKQARTGSSAPEAAEMEVLEDRQLMAGDMIGVVRSGAMNGFDGWYMNTDNDSAHEIDQMYGLNDDTFVVGNWFGTGDRSGVVREGANGLLQWHFDRDGDPTVEGSRQYGFNTDTPVVGDWNGDGRTDLGAVRKGTDGLLNWYLDTNGDTTHDLHFKFGLNNGHKPVVGDWDRDGKDEIGVFDSGGHFHLNTDSDVWAERSIRYGFGSWTPVTGDFDGDGFRDDVGVVQPTGGLLKWHFDHDADGRTDRIADFGLSGDTPVTGAFRHAEADVEVLKDGRWEPVYDGSQHVHAVRLAGADINTQAEWTTLRIVNRGTENLQITQAHIPDGFEISGGELALPIAPGKTRTFQIRALTDTAGLKTGQLSFRTNDGGENPYNFQLVAAIKDPSSGGGDVIKDPSRMPEISISIGNTELRDGAARVTFDRKRLNAPLQEQVLTIKNTGTAPLTISGMRYPNMLRVSETRFTIPAGGSRQLVISMVTNRIGRLNGTLQLVSNDKDESHFDIAVTGEVFRNEASPEISVRHLAESPGGFVQRRELVTGRGEVNLGSIRQGTRARTQHALLITNHGQGALHLNGLRVPRGFRVSGNTTGTLAPGQSRRISVELDQSQAGSFNGWMTIANNDSNESQFRVRLRGRVDRALRPAEAEFRIDGRVVTGRAGFDFGGIIWGGRRERTLTVRNLGDMPLQISNLRLVRGYRITGIHNGMSLRSGQSIRVGIYPDGTVGEHRGTFSFQTNDTTDGESNFAIDLRARVFPAVSYGLGSPITPKNNVLTVQAHQVRRIVVMPAHGRVPFGTRYLVTLGSNTFSYSGLSSINLTGPNARHVVVENWTSLPVRRNGVQDARQASLLPRVAASAKSSGLFIDSELVDRLIRN